MTELKTCPKCGGVTGGKIPCRCYRASSTSGSFNHGLANLGGLGLLGLILTVFAFVLYCAIRFFTTTPDDPFFMGSVGTLMLAIGAILGVVVGGILAIVLLTFTLMGIHRCLKHLGLKFDEEAISGTFLGVPWFGFLGAIPYVMYDQADRSFFYDVFLSIVCPFCTAISLTMLVGSVGAVWYRILERTTDENQRHLYHAWLGGKNFGGQENKSFQFSVLLVVFLSFWLASLSLIAATIWPPYTWLMPLFILYLILQYLLMSRIMRRKRWDQ